MSRKSTNREKTSPVDVKDGAGTPHVVRVTLLGFSGLSHETISTLQYSPARPTQRKSSRLKVPSVPTPSNLRAFVSLTRQTKIGTKYLPPLCRTLEEDHVQHTANDVEISVDETKQQKDGDYYHVSWPEAGVVGRENKFVFETLLNKAQEQTNGEPPSYTPKAFNFEIGLCPYPQDGASSDQISDECCGIVLGTSSLTLNGNESYPPSLISTVDLRTTIFSQVLYLPISTSVDPTQSKHSKLKDSVRELTLHVDRNSNPSKDKNRKKKKGPTPPTLQEVEAFQSNYSFKKGQAFLVVTVEVYKKASYEEHRTEFIRKQIKRQNTKPSSDVVYSMFRYSSPRDQFSSGQFISHAIQVYTESICGNSTGVDLGKKQSSSDSDPIPIASMSSLMDDSGDESNKSSSSGDESDTESEEDHVAASVAHPKQSNPQLMQNVSNSLIRRINSCSDQGSFDPPQSKGTTVGSVSSSIKSSSEAKPNKFSFFEKSYLSGVSDFFTRFDPTLCRIPDTTAPKVIKKSTHIEPIQYDDDQTIFSGIPYFADNEGKMHG